MSITMTETDNGSGLTIQVPGSVDENAFMKAMEAILTPNENECQAYRYCILSFTAASSIDLSTYSLHRLSSWCEKIAAHTPGMLVAIVSDQDLTFGLARMWESFMTGCTWKIGVFRRSLDARLWIRKSIHDSFDGTRSDLPDRLLSPGASRVDPDPHECQTA